MKRNTRLLIIGMWTITALAAVGLGGTLLLLRSQERIPAGAAAVMIDNSATAGETGQKLPVLFDAPPFALTDENGAPFRSDALRGKVWVADFIFTHCPALCPLMTHNLAQFQKITADMPRGRQIQRVSFTVDPDRDTPPVLKQYALTNQADLSRWHFLTGTKDQTWDISKAMKLAVQPDRGSQVMHSSHFLLIDQQGHVRGVYDFDSPGVLQRLSRDAELLNSPS